MAQMLGVPAAHRKSFAAPPCEVWACNWPTVQLFIAMGTQWRSGMNGATGLDYAALPIVARGLCIKLTPSRFNGIRAMESAVLKIFVDKNGQ